jgi:Flp pilus assembly pilin Flp
MRIVGLTGSIRRRLLATTDGQDVVEYALLAAVFGLAAIGAFDFIASRIGAAYPTYDSSVQCLSEPCDPGRTRATACGPCQ